MIKLTPFGKESNKSIEASLGLNGAYLELNFTWSISSKLFPNLEPSIVTTDFKRKIGLWEENCLEAFLARPDRDEYYEFNFSLDTIQWNCFKLSSYRFGLKETNDFQIIKKRVENNEDKCEVSFLLDLGKEAMNYMKSMKLVYNLCAISNDLDGQTFWAFKHPESKPDFHDKKYYLPSDKLSKGV